MASLASRYAKIGVKNKHASVLSKSKFFDRSNRINLPVYAMNIAHSGSLFTGFSPGLIQLAGKSKHFKSGFMLVHVLAFQKKYPNGVVFFYDSEFGSDADYFANAGVNTENVVHIPLENIEGFKFDLMQKLEQIKEDKDNGEEIDVMIAIDSIGNLASKKEVEDSLNDKSVADMTRAKQLKSLWRMVTPQLTLLGICCVAINHTYSTMEMYAKDVVSGGCLLAGTKIKLADGSTKEIQDIKIGDFVKTVAGSKEVTHTWNPETLEDGTPECLELEFDDGYKVVCSWNHPFLVQFIDGTADYVKAIDLDEDMEIISIT